MFSGIIRYTNQHKWTQKRTNPTPVPQKNTKLVYKVKSTQNEKKNQKKKNKIGSKAIQGSVINSAISTRQ